MQKQSTRINTYIVGYRFSSQEEVTPTKHVQMRSGLAIITVGTNILSKQSA